MDDLKEVSTSDLFKKHFNKPVVSLKHPNIENFFNELNQVCINEDLNKLKRVKNG